MEDKTVLETYLNNVESEMRQFIGELNQTALSQAKDLILNQESKGNRVHVTGIGKPGHVASYIASLLSSTGTAAYFLDGTEAVHGSSGQVHPGDVVIAISNSGETQELMATVETLKMNEAFIVAVSGGKNSWLANHSDVYLYAGVKNEGDPLNKPPRASILAEVLVLQSLSVLLQEAKGLDAKQYVKWHPGGSLGKQIKEQER